MWRWWWWWCPLLLPLPLPPPLGEGVVEGAAGAEGRRVGLGEGAECVCVGGVLVETRRTREWE